MFGPNTATPMLAANRLARWSLMLSQYEYTIEYRSTKQHGNADALSRLPVGPDLSFDGEEGDNDVDTVCTIRVINSQLQPHSRNQLKDATNRDPVLSEVKRYVREGWPQKIDTPDVQEFKKYAASLSVTDDCLINGNRVVIPEAMQPQILDILHFGTLWYAEDEAVGTFCSVLASHRQPDRRYMQRMCVLCRTSEQTSKASQPPLDDA